MKYKVSHKMGKRVVSAKNVVLNNFSFEETYIDLAFDFTTLNFTTAFIAINLCFYGSKFSNIPIKIPIKNTWVRFQYIKSVICSRTYHNEKLNTVTWCSKLNEAR